MNETMRAIDILHAEALDEDNQRAKREVERYMTSRDAGRIANPKLARFLAEREDARRFPRVTPATNSPSAYLGHCPTFGYEGAGYVMQEGRVYLAVIDGRAVWQQVASVTRVQHILTVETTDGAVHKIPGGQTVTIAY